MRGNILEAREEWSEMRGGNWRWRKRKHDKCKKPLEDRKRRVIDWHRSQVVDRSVWNDYVMWVFYWLSLLQLCMCVFMSLSVCMCQSLFLSLSHSLYIYILIFVSLSLSLSLSLLPRACACACAGLNPLIATATVPAGACDAYKKWMFIAIQLNEWYWRE